MKAGLCAKAVLLSLKASSVHCDVSLKYLFFQTTDGNHFFDFLAIEDTCNLSIGYPLPITSQPGLEKKDWVGNKKRE